MTYASYVGAAQVGWLVAANLPLKTSAALAVAVTLFAVEALGPVVAERNGARRASGSTPWHPHHLSERFALLTIIALGETVFGTLASTTEISTQQGWTIDAVVTVGAGTALSFALWWTYFLVPHLPVLVARREKVLSWAYAHMVLYAAIAAVGAGLHVTGYADEPGYELSNTTVVASVAVPVIVFVMVRYLLQASLVSALPRDTAVQLSAMALPGVAMALAAAGLSVSGCLVIVLASPVSIILSFELGGWRSLDAQLDRVTRRAGPAEDPAHPGGTSDPPE